MTFFTNQLIAKRLELLREMVPGRPGGRLREPAEESNAASNIRDIERRRHAMRLQVQVNSTPAPA